MRDKIRPKEQWTDARESVMTDILKNKCVQAESSREMFRSVTKVTIFAESTYNDTGHRTEQRSHGKYKDRGLDIKKKLGQIIRKIKKPTEIRKRKKSDQLSNPSQKHQSKVNTKQRDFAQLLRDLLYATSHQTLLFSDETATPENLQTLSNTALNLKQYDYL